MNDDQIQLQLQRDNETGVSGGTARRIDLLTNILKESIATGGKKEAELALVRELASLSKSVTGATNGKARITFKKRDNVEFEASIVLCKSQYPTELVHHRNGTTTIEPSLNPPYHQFAVFTLNDEKSGWPITVKTTDTTAETRLKDVESIIKWIDRICTDRMSAFCVRLAFLNGTCNK